MCLRPVLEVVVTYMGRLHSIEVLFSSKIAQAQDSMDKSKQRIYSICPAENCS